MKNKKKQENYLDKKPIRNPEIKWSADNEGVVTLEIENKGIMKRLTQLLLKKPKVSYIHLDEMGSFVWPIIDGETDITALGEKVDAHFGEKAHPLYERLSRYIQILASYKFVTFK